MAATRPIGLPWNFPLFGEAYRSVFAAPRYRLQRVPIATQPPVPVPPAMPLSLEDVVLHLRLAPDAVSGPEKPLLEGMIAAATRHLEDYAGVTLMRTGWRMTMRHWPPVWTQPLDLPMPPFDELLSIEVLGAAQDINDYVVQSDEAYGARLYPKSGYWQWAWTPTPDLVKIGWIAGREKTEDIAPPLRQALLMCIAHWYENRESSQQWQLYPVLELGWQNLLSHYRDVGSA